MKNMPKMSEEDIESLVRGVLALSDAVKSIKELPIPEELREITCIPDRVMLLKGMQFLDLRCANNVALRYREEYNARIPKI
jgi:hypothetical protein